MSTPRLRSPMEMMRDAAPQRSPVIVTFDEDGQVCDVFGDVTYYADDQRELADLLLDLLVGWQAQGALTEIRMPSGSYSDVRLVNEGALRHVILFDTSAESQERREVLQASHEQALTERRRRIELERQSPPHDHVNRTSELLELLCWHVGPQIDEICGFAQLLAERAPLTETQVRSIACIKRAAMHLHGLLSACVWTVDPAPRAAAEQEPLDLWRLAGELQRQWGVHAQLPRLSFDVRLASTSAALVGADSAKVQQMLVCCISSLLDAGAGGLNVVLTAKDAHLLVEFQLEMPADSGDANWLERTLLDRRYVAAEAMLREMGGIATAMPNNIGLRLEVPFGFALAAPKSAVPARTAYIVIDEDILRQRVLDQLETLGAQSQRCEDLADLQERIAREETAVVILGGGFAGGDGLAMSYRVQTQGADRRMLLLRHDRQTGPSAWVWDGRRAIVSARADDGALRAAIEGVLGP